MHIVAEDQMEMNGIAENRNKYILNLSGIEDRNYGIILERKATRQKFSRQLCP